MNTHVFHFYNSITPKTQETFKNQLLTATCQRGAEEIAIFLSSEGGDLNSGFSLYNLIRSLPVPVSITNVGTVESIAMMVFLATDKRYAIENSRFLIHQFHWTYSNYPIPYSRLKENVLSLDFDTARYEKIFNERTNCGNGIINISQCLNGQAVVIDPSTAASAGIIDKIVPVENSIKRDGDGFINWWI